MRIQACDSYFGFLLSPPAEKVRKQQPNPLNLGFLQSDRNIAQWEMGRDEGNRDLPTGEQHREIVDLASRGKELCLPRELESDFVHARLMNRSCDDGVNGAVQRSFDRFLKGSRGGARRFRRGLAWLARRVCPDYLVICFCGEERGVERSPGNLRSDTGRIA